MLKKIMTDNKFTLIVSLPKNDVDLVEESLLAGADSVKVHLNVHHFASGQKYGSFLEEKDFLLKASDLVKKHGKILGVVVGEGGEYTTNAELDSMYDLGVDFISTYVEYAPVRVLNHKDLELCVAVGPTTQDYVIELDEMGTEVIEASIFEHEDYRKDITILDLCKFKRITSLSNKPILIPTQKNIKPSDIKSLADIGCKGIMIGAVVFENKDQSFGEVVKSYRDAIDQL